MKQNILNLIFAVALILCGTDEAASQERPKLREISDKKYEAGLKGVVPCTKKDECGYADPQGKFIIPAIFHKVMPMSDRHVGFVCFLDELGKEYWTPISLRGLYLTDLNFSQVIKDFDDRGMAVVRQGDKYGIISYTGKMVAGCNYQHYEDKNVVYLLYSDGGGCIAVAKDKSEKGYTAYSFAAREPIIVQTEGGYGIISQKNYFTVADFVYDSVKELVTWEAYCLQKDSKSYLYAADKLSMGYEEIISVQDGAYFVVKHNGKYGILTSENEVLLSCSQDEIPVLKKNEYTCLYENGSPVYLTIGKRATPSEYDDYLYTVKHRGVPVEYMLDQTLAFESKKYVRASLSACYGTKNFDLLSHLDVAKEYAESRRFVLLSSDTRNARFYDLESGSLVNYGEILYHAFPSKSGAPAFATVLRYGKFGIIDIRNGSTLLPAEYDNITPIRNNYVCLQKADSLYLYHVSDNLMITTHACKAIEDTLLDWDLAIVSQGGKERLYNIVEHRWTLPEDHSYESLVPLPGKDDLVLHFAALMKNGGKGALFEIRTGEKLTEYLFDQVENELIGGKYNVVVGAGKKGLYDVETQKYVLPCEYAKVEGYHTFNGEEFVIVTKAGKQGIYNISKSKLIVTAYNDAIDMRGGFARIRRGGKYGVYSLEYNKMMFDSPVEEVELMNDGYVLLKGPNSYEKGVYNLNWNEWYIDPMPGHDMCFLGGDYVGVASKGVGNYKTNKLIRRLEEEWIDSYIGVDGNFVIMNDPIEGASMWVYKLDDPHFLLNGSSIDVLTENNTSMQGRNLAIVLDFQYGEGWEILSVRHCKLQDLDSGRLILSDSYNGLRFTGMEYIDPGLVCVTMENEEVWLFDIMTERWLLRANGKIATRKLGGNRVSDNDTYISIRLADDTKYLFDINERVLVKLTDSFGLRDYADWKNTKSLVPSSSVSGCDRIALMFNSQKSE